MYLLAFRRWARRSGTRARADGQLALPDLLSVCALANMNLKRTPKDDIRIPPSYRLYGISSGCPSRCIPRHWKVVHVPNPKTRLWERLPSTGNETLTSYRRQHVCKQRLWPCWKLEVGKTMTTNNDQKRRSSSSSSLQLQQTARSKRRLY